MIAYRQIGERFIPARHQPALALDFARSQELDGDAGSAQILRGTGLHGWELPAADTLLTPHEYLQLLAQLTRALGSPETSFLLGQQMLPGHYGALSHALLQAQNLRQALEILCLGHAQLCPLLTPRFREEGGLAVLYWRDSFGAPSQLPALVEMHMTAVTAMCHWLGGEALPWRYCLNRSAPAHVEQHEVYLGSDLRFNCHLDAMLIDPALLDRAWPRGNAMAASAAMQAALAGAQAGMQASVQASAQAGAQAGGAAGAGAVSGLVSGSASGSVSNSVSKSVPDILTPGLLAALYDYLLEHIRLGPTLEGTAQAFGVSPATLKRHLARHGSHFQAELDGVRAHVAMQLFQMRGYDNEAVAHYLGFHDATNFRRSFKRWTGLVPSLLRDGLLRG